MIWYVVISQILLAIALFFLVNWLGAQSTSMGYMQLSIGMQDDTSPAFNYLFKVLTPVVFIVLVAAFFQFIGHHEFNKNIYLIVVYYWIIRLLVIILQGHASLQNWPVQFLYWISSITLAVWFYSLIDKLDTILPTPQTLIEQLWLLIILFIYSVLNKLEISRASTEQRKKNYVIRKYQQFHEKFGEQVDGYMNIDFLRALTFAIMIYEDFNRSKLIRFLERLLFKYSDKKHTYGIMQVKSDHVLSDAESLNLGMEKIVRDCREAFFYQEIPEIYDFNLVKIAAKGYNGGDEHYSSEVLDVYLVIKEDYYSLIPEMIQKSSILKGVSR